MNNRRHSLTTLLLGAVSLSLLPVGSASSQTATATTDPVGFTTATLQANSDTLISIPFTRPAAFTGAIASVSGSTITLSNSPGFTPSGFVYASGSQSNTYYAIIGPLNATLTGTLTATNGSVTVTGSGTTFGTDVKVGDALTINGAVYTVAAVNSTTTLTLDKVFAGTTASALSATYDHSPKEGSYYTVTANDAGTLTVNLNGDSLASVAAGTSVSVIPYWTLGTAFPASDANVSYVPSVGKSRPTQILMPDMNGIGTDLAATPIFYNQGGTWLLSGGNSTSANDTVLPPGTYFTVRNTSAATTFTPNGSVYMNRITVPLDTQTNTAQDNAVAVTRPANTTLNDLGLIASKAFATSSGKVRQDLLLTFDNSVVGNDKSAANIYYYDTAWRLAGSTGGDYGNTVLPYGTGFVIRKAATTTGTSVFWQNARNY